MRKATQFLVVAIFFLVGVSAHATTYTSPDCTFANVQATYNTEHAAAVDGDVIVIPACAAGVSWTSTLTLNPTNSLTVQGQTTCTGTPTTTCTDGTVLIDNINRSSTDPAMIQVNTVAGKSFRITGITINGGSGGTTFDGSLRIFSATSGEGSSSVRVDHNHFFHIGLISSEIRDVQGVADHNWFDMNSPGSANGMKMYHPKWNGDTHGNGDGSWTDGSHYGTSQFFFMEDNLGTSGFIDDCAQGGRFVIRHNTLTNSPTQTHQMSGRLRGCRAYEIYQNNWTALAPSTQDTAFFDTMGDGMFWGNTVNTGYNSGSKLRVDRTFNVPYTYNAPPAGFGFCGPALGPSTFDGNTTNGYPCMDQIGRGTGDLLTGGFTSDGSGTNNVANAANGCAAPYSSCSPWPRNAVEPFYEWLDTFNSTFGVVSTSDASYNDLQANRDYFTAAGCTVGGGAQTAGTCNGLFSARQTNCTQYVAYWATDQSTLYQCSATNTWAAYYTPFAYPHPLQNSTTFTYVQDSSSTYCSNGASSCTINAGNILTTTAGTVWILAVQTSTNVAISTVCGTTGTGSCAGTNDGWVHCTACQIFSSGLSTNLDVWYTTSGPAGTQGISFTLSGGSGTKFGANFIELLPPPGTTASFDAGGNTSATNCAPSCTGVGLTIHATDAIVQILHANSVSDAKAYSAPYITDINSDGIALAATSGTAPTVKIASGSVVMSGIAFSTSAGSFTPVSLPISLANYSQTVKGTPINCTPGCNFTIPATTSGNMLFVQQGGTTHISSITCLGCTSWTVPSGANTCQIAQSGYSTSCGYLLSVPAGITSLSITMSGTAVSFFEVWELSNSSGGGFTFDGQSSGANSASFSPLGRSIGITGSNDAIFQSLIVPGGSSAISYYPQPYDEEFGGCCSGNTNPNFSAVGLLNTASGAAPNWVNQQNNATTAAAIAFTAAGGTPPPPPPTVGCGATAGGVSTDQSTCGNVGDAYEGNGPPAGQIAVSACGVLGNGPNYVLTQSVGTDPTIVCISSNFPSQALNVDLGGFTVTGAVKLQNNNAGDVLYHGTVTCNIVGTTSQACISDGYFGRVHHITVQNNNAAPLANINLQGTTGLSNPWTVRIDHVTSTVVAAPNANRTRNIYDDGASGGNPAVKSLSLEADNNLITCLAGASACQGIEMYDALSNSVHNNNFVLPATCPSCSDTPRGIIFDNGSTGDASFNTFLVLGNRGIRVRNGPGGSALTVNIHDNGFLQIAAPGRFAAVHVGENDSTIEDENVNVYTNLFELAPSGNGIISAAATNVNVYTNTVACYQNNCSGVGNFVETGVPSTLYGQTGTTVLVENNNVAPLTAAGIPALMVCGVPGNPTYVCTAAGTSTTQGTICNSGSAVGNGTINSVNPPCPNNPAVSFTTTSVSFGNQAVGTGSTPVSVTLTNTGLGTLTLNTPYFSFTGTNANDFSNAGTGSCANGGAVNVGTSCTINLVFTPSVSGAESATLNISGNATGSLPLSGTGTTSGISFSPASISFGAQPVNTVSGISTTTLTNTGTATLTISSVTNTAANIYSFVTPPLGADCTITASLGPSASCVIAVTFTPNAVSVFPANITITDSAAGSPHTVPVTGTGFGTTAPAAPSFVRLVIH